MMTLTSPTDLARFARYHGIAPDWQGAALEDVEARVQPQWAGPTSLNVQPTLEELVVVLTVDGADAAQVPLATLLAWGDQLGTLEQRAAG